MDLILQKKIHFRENWLIFWGIWGETELILRILEAKVKYFEGAEEFFFLGFGEINALLLGSKGAQTPTPVASSLSKLTNRFDSHRNFRLNISIFIILIAILILTSVGSESPCRAEPPTLRPAESKVYFFKSILRGDLS